MQGVVVLYVYLPQLVGSLLGVSGIVTTLTAGMACRKFIFPTIEEPSQDRVIGILKMLSDFAETAAFVNLGLSCIRLNYQQYNLSIIIGSLVLCAISRPIQVPSPLNINFDFKQK